jgi:hypothetical protein
LRNIVDKQSRFISVSAKFAKDIIGLIIVDYNWWFINEAEVKSWCNETMKDGWVRQGMIINFDNEENRLQFLLRWGS